MDRVHDSSTDSKTGAALQPGRFRRDSFARTSAGGRFQPWRSVVLAGAYSLVAPRKWEATQALIVRPEAASVSEERIGKFSDLSEMKTLQETILELAKSQSVVQATLRRSWPAQQLPPPGRMADRARCRRLPRHASTCGRPAAPSSARRKCSTSRFTIQIAIGPAPSSPPFAASSNRGCKSFATSGPRA